MPKFSNQVEVHVLGGLLKHPDVLAEVASFLSAEDFYNNVHQTIYCVLRESILNGEKVDKVLIANKIANLGISSKDDIDIFDYTTNDYKTIDYTIHFENTETQAQKLLLMQNNTSVHTNEFAIMYTGSGPIVSVGSTIDGSNIKVVATPETGISGLTTYRWNRYVQK